MTASDLATDPLLAGVPVQEGYKVLGGVVLYQKLGAGGMGAVYRGRHLRLNIDVAVKVMDPPAGVQASRAGEFVRRFIREAQTAAAVQHQNLIRVYDVNTEGDVHFLIMDFVDGESAGDRLKRKGKLNEAEAVEIALGAAEGLAEAHAKGIVHRDVKPDNIMIDKKGKVRVADLGLAKAVSREDAEGPSELTEAQQAVGTPQYMPLEQFSSARDVGPPADVWALGVTLYRLLTGRLPWEATNVIALIAMMQSSPPQKAKGLRPDLSEGVCRIIDGALRKDPGQRYPDCGRMAEALRSHLGEIRALPGGTLADAEAGATKTMLVSVTPPPPDMLTLISASALGEIETTQLGERSSAGEPTVAPERRRRWLPLAAIGLLVILAAVGAAGYSALKNRRHRSAETKRATEYRKGMDEAQRLVLAGKLAQAAQTHDSAEEYCAATAVAAEAAARANAEKADAERLSELLDEVRRLAGDTSLSVGDDIKMSLVLMQPGEFAMGSPPGEAHREEDEGPQHRVRITRPFYVGQVEVTQAEYQHIMGINPSYFKAPHRPVDSVSWDDAMEFCRRLSQRTGKKVRLPTEAEWEYACRAGTTTPYCFGSDEAKVGDYAWYGLNSDSKTESAYLKSPNAWNLHGMLGNVWEWCSDWYDEAYYSKSPRDDPSGPASGRFRVLRGGAIYSHAWECRSALRYHGLPDWGDRMHGFRVAVEIPPSSKARRPPNGLAPL